MGVTRSAVRIATLAVSMMVPGMLWAEQARANATAFVVAADGHLLTCAHVLKNAVHVQVSVRGETYDATLLATDEKNDLAVVKIPGKDLPTLPLADSDSVQLGLDVRAFGFPLAHVLGEDVKVTKGTIAGVSQREAHKVFQIDVAVNPGNSGGPLVNDRGEVIGVVNAKLVHVAVSNVGFAVPINYAKPLLRDRGVGFKTEGAKPKPDGPGLVQLVSPAVALVTVFLRSTDQTNPAVRPKIHVDHGGLEHGMMATVRAEKTPIKLGQVVVAWLTKGQRVKVHYVQGGWVRVWYTVQGEAKVGYVAAADLEAPPAKDAKVEAPPYQPEDEVVVTRDTKLMMGKETLGTVSAGTQLTVKKVNDKWLGVFATIAGKRTWGWIEAQDADYAPVGDDAGKKEKREKEPTTKGAQGK